MNGGGNVTPLPSGAAIVMPLGFLSPLALTLSVFVICSALEICSRLVNEIRAFDHGVRNFYAAGVANGYVAFHIVGRFDTPGELAAVRDARGGDDARIAAD